MSAEEQPRGELVPGVVRLGASVWWHTTEWALGTSMRAGRRLLEVAIAPEKAPGLVEDLRGVARDVIRGLVDVTDIDQRLRDAGAGEVVRRVAEAVPIRGEVVEEEPATGSPNGAGSVLRQEGELLLHRSRDVHYDEDAHPAYERIMSELAPDEARILRLLLLDGPQPSVDIRTGGPIGLINSRLIAPGLNMIGARAGCRYVERVPAYLNNLFRLGMVWFSRETLRDPLRYQVLEAQPDVLEAMHSVRYAKIVRRSIHLTPFGEDFCRVAFSIELQRAIALPEHSAPPTEKRAPVPPAVDPGS